MHEYKMLIGGELDGGDRWTDVINPANEKVIGRYPVASSEQLDRTVELAGRAFDNRRATSLDERAERVEQLVARVEAHADLVYARIVNTKGHL